MDKLICYDCRCTALFKVEVTPSHYHVYAVFCPNCGEHTPATMEHDKAIRAWQEMQVAKGLKRWQEKHRAAQTEKTEDKGEENAPCSNWRT